MPANQNTNVDYANDCKWMSWRNTRSVNVDTSSATSRLRNTRVFPTPHPSGTPKKDLFWDFLYPVDVTTSHQMYFSSNLNCMAIFNRNFTDIVPTQTAKTTNLQLCLNNDCIENYRNTIQWFQPLIWENTIQHLHLCRGTHNWKTMNTHSKTLQIHDSLTDSPLKWIRSRLQVVETGMGKHQ